MSPRDELAGLLDALDEANCECDGLTRLVTTALHWNEIPHSVFKGAVRRKRPGDAPDLVVAPHYWVVVEELWQVQSVKRFWPFLNPVWGVY